MDGKNNKVFLWNKNIRKVDLSEYTHIRAYHACRTTNVEAYLKEGIHTFNRKRAYKMVRERLMQCNIEEKEISRCFNERWNNEIYHFDTICVNISKEELLNESGHYLVYGSEFICGMAVDLFCQQKLKKIGIPTLFECHIDKRKFSLNDLHSIENNEMENGIWDGGIYLRDDISADEIEGYIQTKKIYDPVLGYYYYR